MILLQDKQAQLSQLPLIRRGLVTWPAWRPSTEIALLCPSLSVRQSPKSDMFGADVVPQVLSKGQWPLPLTCGSYFSTTAQCLLGLCHKDPRCSRVLSSDVAWASAGTPCGCAVQRWPGDVHISGELHMGTLSIISSTLWKTVETIWWIPGVRPEV